MSTWLVRTYGGEFLGEVEAEGHVHANGLADERWAERHGPLLVWHKKLYNHMLIIKEQAFRRRRTASAYHESGHAVLAWHFGLDVSRIEIGFKPNQSGGRFAALIDSYGSASFGDERPRSVSGGEWAERTIMAIMGGPMAEYRYRGRPDWEAPNRRRLKGSDALGIRVNMTEAQFRGCECLTLPGPGDFSLARHRLHCIPLYYERLRQRAAQALDVEWPQVQAVAIELQLRGILDAAAFEALLSVPRKKAPPSSDEASSPLTTA
ncbi:hypothetical protein [Paludisphaera mucosa]|uniref:ATP-dependent zinc metalloprotease FtsH n=1 Tax=Paludisphaera mucosa TaxID=3030827 RepID=A0ABT6FE69_9BACT|nr:hypothetical protein [Paludisphaera mucosa]MDG3005865.1 hypothetical protein [Paludisphaera mucosa]